MGTGAKGEGVQFGWCRDGKHSMGMDISEFWERFSFSPMKYSIVVMKDIDQTLVQKHFETRVLHFLYPSQFSIYNELFITGTYLILLSDIHSRILLILLSLITIKAWSSTTLIHNFT